MFKLATYCFPFRQTAKLLLLCCFFVGALTASAQTFSGTSQPIQSLALGKKFKNYEIFQIDATALAQAVRQESPASEVKLLLGPRQWTLALSPNNILSKDYRLRVLKPDGSIEERVPTAQQRAFKGIEKQGGGRVRLTLNDHFIYGFVESGGETWYIEPLYDFLPESGKDLFIVYPQSSVVHGEGLVCGTEISEEMLHKYEKDIKNQMSSGTPESLLACYEVELAIASDRSMFDKYGTNVEDHNIAVINSITPNYASSFIHVIQFAIVTQFVVSGTDPWTSSTVADQLLTSFQSWGNAGNFGVPFDIGEIWTNRDFNGGTIGIAFLNGLCNNFKYHCLQDFSSNADFLRVLCAHEIGHNFNCSHDGSGCPGGFIMCPSVNSSNTWSAASISAANALITNRLNSGGCLSPCGTSGGGGGGTSTPPDADFSWSPNPACVGQAVSFTDLSTGTYQTRAWVFPGGSPTSSTQANPTVTWNVAGTYNVRLTVSGTNGTSTVLQPVVVQGLPVPNFTFVVNGTSVTFNNTTPGTSNTYLWNFGDNTTSTDEDPIHEYAVGGTYTVTLTATNNCGSNTVTKIINTIPTPDFSATPVAGCPPLVVHFTNLSSANATSFQWQFPGGTPATSTVANPTITYTVPGQYDVTLIATNSVGADFITKIQYITVQDPPIANFTFDVVARTVTFTNTSDNATTYSWNFGDNTPNSSQTNPVHTYALPGTYTVTLTATGPCGTDVFAQIVVIVPAPTANFTASNRTGCAPFSVQYTNATTGNPTAFSWQFPGGTPATSTEENPLVTYNTQGAYSVTLVASNNGGSSTATQANYISVGPPPVPSFTATVGTISVSFLNSSTNATSYEWTFGDGDGSTLTNPTHTYSADGTYEVVLTAYNSCGAVSTSRNIVISTPPTAGFSATNRNGCAPFSVTYNNISSANATGFNWQFPGGTPASSTAQSPTVVYNTPGSYAVTLTVSNAAGTNTASQNNYISVGPAPAAVFSSSVNGLTATFSNTSGNATSYLWNFGNGGTSTQANPTVTYAADGVYTVTLTATNGCGSNTTTRTLTIVTPPSAGFTATNATGCGPLQVQFNNTSSANAATFNWQFAGGNPGTSTDANPLVVYTTPGTYTAVLTVSNAAGTSTTAQVNVVTVQAPPTTGFTAANNGAVVTFANNSTNAVSYNWNFGNGNSSTQANPVYTYPADGTYTVVLTATNACGSTTATQTVVVVTPPTAGFTALNTSGCAPLSVQYTNAASANATTFNWQFPGGTPSSSTAQNPLVSYSTPGTYSASLTVGNAAGNNTATQTNLVTVGGIPTTGFTAANNGAVVTFANSSTNAVSYNWNFGNGNGSSQANPVYTYPADGTYTVVLTATNACGSTTATQTVVVVTPPIAGFTALNTSGCAPLSVQYTSTASANATAFNWQFPGGTPSSSTAQNPVVSYSTPGTYSASLTVGNAAGNNTATQTNLVTVGGAPTTGFTAASSGAVTTFTNSSTNAVSYEWNFGNGNGSSQANPVYTYPADGTYTVVLTATNACGSTTATQTVVVVTPPTAGFIANNTNGCAPLSVQFANTSSANATAFNWEFPGGTPATSTVANPTVVYDIPGVYGVTLTVNNVAGSSTLSQVGAVIVGGMPSASFTKVVNGGVVAFTNTSSNAVSYLWDFGNGGFSAEQNPTFSYSTNGTYTVTLTATNICGSTTSSQMVVVLVPPTAGFIAGNTAGCGPLNVQYISSASTNATSFSWQFPGGSPSTSIDPNPVVVYYAPGIYNATLIVGNAAGQDTAIQVGLVNVYSGPTAGFSSTVNVFAATFVNLSNNANTYVWDFGDGTGSTEANPTHIYAVDGTYTVTLTAQNYCSTNVYTQNVVVLTSPTAGFTANTTTGCGPLTVQFSDLSTANTTAWNWSFPGGTPASSTQQNPVVVYQTPGQYDVALVASTGLGSSTFERKGFVTVNAAPAASFQTSANGAIIQFANTSGNANSYSWSFGDGNNSIDANPTHHYLASGTYTVTLVATNPCGSTTETQTIVVTGPPPVAVFTANQTSGCGPLSVTFTDQSTGSPSTWAWFFQGGVPSVSSAQNPTVVYPVPGTYPVVMYVSNAYGADTLIVGSYVNVRGLPLTNFAAAVNAATVSFTNLTPGVTTFAWNFGDNTTSNIANPVHTYLIPGTYAVRLTTTNDCGSSTIEQQVNVLFTGTENLAEVWKLRVFPNPNTGMFAVEAQGLPTENIEMTLFNALGQLVGREMLPFNQAQSIHTLDYQHLAAGVYSLRLQAGAKTAVVPLVVHQH